MNSNDILCNARLIQISDVRPGDVIVHLNQSSDLVLSVLKKEGIPGEMAAKILFTVIRGHAIKTFSFYENMLTHVMRQQ